MEQTIAKVKIDDLSFQQLMLDIKNRNIRIPDFQREFVWEQSQIVNLLDSIYHHYPVGSFLFWRTREEIESYRTIGDFELGADKDGLIYYVLDGQQRITSLFACLEEVDIKVKVHGKTLRKRLDIHFDLDDEVFVADPFGRKMGDGIYRPKRLLAIPDCDDYLAFLRLLADKAETFHFSRDDTAQWLAAYTGRSQSVGVTIFNDCVNWRLFEWVEGRFGFSHSKDVIYDESPTRMLEVLATHFAWFETLLAQLEVTPKVTEEDLKTAISSRSDEDIDQWYLRQRLLWLVGLGIGTFQDKLFAVSDNGLRLLEAYRQRRTEQKQCEEERERVLRQRYLSVKQVTSDHAIIDLGMELGHGQRLDALKRVVGRFKSYPFSVIYVLDQPVDVACEIFERINNSGRVLNLVDLMVAKCFSPTFNLRDKMNEFLRELASHRYADIPDVTVLQCTAAIIGKSIKRKDILTLDKSAVAEQWNDIAESIRKAVDFLKASLNLTDSRILPYNTLVVPLAYFFYFNEDAFPSECQKSYLLRWFWMAAFTSRYDSAVETKINDDLEEFDKILAGDAPSFDYPTPLVDEERIINQKLNLGSAFCKSVLCLMNQNRPLEFLNNTPVQLHAFSKFNSAQLHHVFPQAYLKKHASDQVDMKDSIANIALAGSALNRKYRDNAPSVYFAECEQSNPGLTDALTSHLIGDLAASGIQSDDYGAFLNYRAERILREIQARVGKLSRTEIDLANDERATVEGFELEMRRLIADVMSRNEPDYWDQLSPDFSDRLEQRIGEWLRTNPGRSREEVDPLVFCQIRDYLKIIKAQWSHFEPIFASRSELEKHLENVSAFRNALMHSREIGRSTRKLAEGSLIWFADIFDRHSGEADAGDET